MILIIFFSVQPQTRGPSFMGAPSFFNHHSLFYVFTWMPNDEMTEINYWKDFLSPRPLDSWKVGFFFSQNLVWKKGRGLSLGMCYYTFCLFVYVCNVMSHGGAFVFCAPPRILSREDLGRHKSPWQAILSPEDSPTARTSVRSSC